ncbi:GNAT family N-acetyltransferase [Sulfitobacter sp. BDSS02]|nr:GNAT family N-acetyltransferase [Sulfitobacter sp. BDSS02]MBR9852516.1 GNAT family N-acetyltransferase [Paracoccaceae bacterium]
MELPDLLPDIKFLRLGRAPGDVDFAFEAKRAAMGPHIVKRWTWDEGFQRDLHERHYGEKPFFEIRRREDRLGTLSLQKQSDHLRFGEFYLFPTHQRQGVGSVILTHCLAFADGIGLPVRLEYLHWNPVGALYQRHGFKEIGRSETHCFMQRNAASQINYER